MTRVYLKSGTLASHQPEVQQQQVDWEIQYLHAMHWNEIPKRKRGALTWRKTMQAELETINISREEAQQAAQDRQRDGDLKSKPCVPSGTKRDMLSKLSYMFTKIGSGHFQPKCTKITEYKLKINTILKLSHIINNI